MSYINNEAVARSEIRGKKTRMSICQLVYTGCDLDFLCLKSNAHILSGCRNKGRRMEETSLEGRSRSFPVAGALTGGWAPGWD